MAAGILAAPGTKSGPCDGDCQHIDCRLVRVEALTHCSFCDEEIGYNTRFYITEEFGHCHALCLEEHYEKTE